MKKSVLFLLTVSLGLLLVAASAFGQTQVSMSFTGWDGAGWDGGGTGFYYGSVNNTQVGPGYSSPGYFCDDFSHEISIPETWSANAYQVSNLLTNWSTLGSNTVYGQGGSTAGLNTYIEMAILVEAAFNGTLGSLDSLGASANDLSAVLWCLDGGPGSACALTTKGGQMTTTQYNLWQWVLKQTTSNYSQFANLWLYVPIPGSQSGTLGTPQEMWGNVAVPEGGTALMYLVLAGGSCLAALFSRSRKKSANAGVA